MKVEPAPAIEIRVDDLHKSFGTNVVLNGVSFTIRRGELVAIVGGSGSGKTVLMDLMIGQLRPDRGSAWLADHESPGSPLVDLSALDQTAMDRLRIHWAVVFQGNALGSGSVEENLSLPLEYVKGFGHAETRDRIRRAVASVGLNPSEVLPVKRDQLSGGMAKRVAIAMAVALEPMLLFLDEPTTGLDPDNALLIENLISKVHEQEQDGFRRTTIVVTHSKDLLHRLRPRVLMLDAGKIIFDGSFSAFAQSPSPLTVPYRQTLTPA
jgi:phospholipid/cholesterol/gamma-HCH transport system ATP-binding protein